MVIEDIVSYWRDQRRSDTGQWLHPNDAEIFREIEHSFNLDFPVSPYVGDIVHAPIIILGANAGYKTRGNQC